MSGHDNINKPTLVLDFDGVIHDYHDYTEGWKDGEIYGKPTIGFFDWAEKAKEYFILYIFSSRSNSHKNIKPMQDWLQVHLWSWKLDNPNTTLTINDFKWPTQKPAAFLTIDDRSICFHGNWEGLNPALLRNFRPWNYGGEKPQTKEIKEFKGYGI